MGKGTDPGLNVLRGQNDLDKFHVGIFFVTFPRRGDGHGPILEESDLKCWSLIAWALAGYIQSAINTTIPQP